MKLIPLLLSSLMASIGSAEARPFGAKTSTRLAPPQQSVLALRGGDLGPLTADTAAKVLVGFQAVNGYPAWQAPEGTLKAWGADNTTSEQKVLIEWVGFNVFSTAMAGIFLLNGANSGTAIGLLSLLYVMESSCGLIEDTAEKLGCESTGMKINLILYSAIAFGNLLNQEWAALANNVGVVWALFNAALALAGKFKEAYKVDTDESSLSKLLMNNVIWTMISNCACFIALVKVPEVSKVIAYSQIPTALLTVYNAFISKPAKEICPDAGRYGYVAIMAALIAAILL